MKKINLLLLVFPFLVCCKTEVKKLEKEREGLSVKLQKLKKEEDSLQNTLKNLDERYDIKLSACSKANTLSLVYASAVFANYHENQISDTVFVDKVIERINLSSKNHLMNALIDNWTGVLSYNTVCKDQTDFFLATFDRHSWSVDYFFSKEKEKVMERIASYFRGNTIYADSNLEATVKCLLLAYKGLVQNKQFGYLKELYSCAEDYHMGGEEGERIINSINSIEDECHEYKVNSIGIYLFWARRYNEDNHETVYEVIEEINNKIHEKEEILQDEEF